MLDFNCVWYVLKEFILKDMSFTTMEQKAHSSLLYILSISLQCRVEAFEKPTLHENVVGVELPWVKFQLPPKGNRKKKCC